MRYALKSTSGKAKPMSDIIVKLPEVTTHVSIGSAWVQARNELIQRAEQIGSITTADQMQEASDCLGQITKTSNLLEKMRKEIAAPFRTADSLIKQAADKARESLELAKSNLSSKMSVYAVAQRKAQEAEQKRIEDEQRKQIEEQLAKQQQAVAAGLADESEPFVPEVAPTVPETIQQKIQGSVVIERIEAQITDSSLVPSELKTVDMAKINSWKRINEERIKKVIRESPAEVLVPGVKFIIVTDVKSTGRRCSH